MRQDRDGLSGDSISGDVVRLTALTGPSRQLSVLMALEDHWRSLAGPEDIPERARVDPRQIGPMLRHTYMASVVAPGLARIRFAGQELSSVFGMDIRGMPICALFDPESRLRIKEAIERVCAGPTIVELPLQSPQGFLRRTLPGRMSLMPLRDETGQISHILGGVIFDGKTIGRTPAQISVRTDRAFRIEPVGTERPRRPPQGRQRLRLVVDNG